MSQTLDPCSGGRLERCIFNHRGLVLLTCTLATLLFGFLATGVRFNASYEKVIPTHHPFVQAYLQNRNELHGLGTSLRIVVEAKKGDIFDADYLNALKEINDEVFLTPGVDRSWMKSLWTPSVRWTEVTEEGFQGGPVMPSRFDGSAASLLQLKMNVARAGLMGSIVADDLRSSTLFVPLLDNGLDYRKLSAALETIRHKYDLPIHIVGFAKIVGDLLDGIIHVALYFAIAFVIAGIFLYYYTSCIRSTALVLTCSLIALVWQLGLVTALGYDLDPYSMLVPFLVFAIGVSHGAQKMNGIMQDIGRGAHRLDAARLTFRRLFLAGLSALVADAVGFGVLMLVDIPVIRDLAVTASIGVGVLVFTNLVLLPVLLSYAGVSQSAAARSLRLESACHKEGWRYRLWNCLDRFAADRRWAMGALLGFGLLAAAGFVVSLGLKIGDLDAGAPELRPDSRYNLDSAFVGRHYSTSSDVFAVIVKTPADACLHYATLEQADQLAWALQQLPEVRQTPSLSEAVKQITAGSYEGNPKWFTLSRNQEVLNYGGQQASVINPDLYNVSCSVAPVLAYLRDHRADTLARVSAVARDFAAQHDSEEASFLPAAGSAGIEAATNEVVAAANHAMLFYVYGAVILLCLITFRSVRAVLVAVIPLAITSILCEALMVTLGIGVKVATLPVIALGVGIGVDYALYLVSVQLTGQRSGLSLAEAYRQALQFTGRVVALVGLTLAAGVVTWVFSPIKFQADMGVLLTFMFLWNMTGALVLIPALSHFLLRDYKRGAGWRWLSW